MLIAENATIVLLGRGREPRNHGLLEPAHLDSRGSLNPVFDTHAIARSLTDADLTPAQG